MNQIEKTPELQAIKELIEVVDSFVEHWHKGKPMTEATVSVNFDKYEFAKEVLRKAHE